MTRRWLLFVHQLPSGASNLRVRVWRRLQQLGALVVKQAVYVLPDSADAREDFEWLKAEIEGAGGQVGVFPADALDSRGDEALVGDFRRARQADYAALAREMKRALSRPRSASRRPEARRVDDHRSLHAFRQRLVAIERIDFFASNGRNRVVELLDRMASRQVPAGSRTSAPPRAGSADTYRRRVWVTRPRPGVDRMASAWLIRRFIDPHARFAFVVDAKKAPPGSVPFDMFGVEFSHHGANCTFETLCAVFGITGRAMTRLAAIVHDLDLKDGRFGAPETPTVGAMIHGLQLAHADDDELLEHGMSLFESLYRAFDRPVTRSDARTARRGKPKGGRIA